MDASWLGDVMGFVVPIAFWVLLMGGSAVRGAQEAAQASPGSGLASPPHSGGKRFWLAIKCPLKLLG